MQSLVFDPGGFRSFTPLPVFGNMARAALRGGSCLDAGWWQSGAFLVNEGVESSFQERTRDPYILRSIAVTP